MSEETIRRLQKRFIAISMMVLITVMMAISGMIFLSNYLITRRTIRNMLDFLIENDGKITNEALIKHVDDDDFENYTILHFLSEIINNNNTAYLSPEFSFSTRFFAVKFDAEGNLMEIQANHISSVSDEEAEEYGRYVLSRHLSFGRYKSYYYRIGRKDDGSSIIVFLDSWIQARANYRLLYLVLIMIGFGVMVTFLLVLFFSKRGIQTEIKNSELQKQFLTDASHELKTPLAVIKANTEMQEMLEGETEWTQSTLRQVDRMSGLISNLVKITKSQEIVKGDRVEINVSEPVRETAESFNAVATSAGKTLNIVVPEKLQMRAHDGDIRQLVSLLVDNAIKYCDESGVITVNLSKRGKGIILTVSNDYKEGKDTDYHLFFERFYRKDESHNADQGGYGIGLSIAENLVKSYKGTINAKWADGVIYFTATLKE